VADFTEADFDAVFPVNARGTLFALQEAARRVPDGGRIINITSSATALMLPGLALYAGSKAAAGQFTRAWRWVLVTVLRDRDLHQTTQRWAVGTR
jgi:3-oxoacyl-[acyl-carrier protein] reductase